MREMRGGAPIVKTLNFNSKKVVEITIRDNLIGKGFTITFTFNVDNFRTGLFKTEDKNGPLLDFMCALLPDELPKEKTTLKKASETISGLYTNTLLYKLAEYEKLKSASETNNIASGNCRYALNVGREQSLYEAVANKLTINTQFLETNGNVKPKYTDCKFVMEFTEDTPKTPKDTQRSSLLQISSIDYIEDTTVKCNRTPVKRCNLTNGPLKNIETKEKPTLHFPISVDDLKTKILGEILSDVVEQQTSSFSLMKRSIEEVMAGRLLTEQEEKEEEQKIAENIQKQRQELRKMKLMREV